MTDTIVYLGFIILRIS